MSAQTAVEIKGKDAQDAPLLPALLDSKAERFTMRQVSADKAYASLDNYANIDRHGATPFIPFKSIHTGRGGGPVGHDVPLLPVPAGRIPHALPQAEQRRIHLLHDEGEVRGLRAEQDRHGDGQRDAVQSALPQHLLLDSD